LGLFIGRRARSPPAKDVGPRSKGENVNRTIVFLICASLLAAARQAKADYLAFDDSQPGDVTVTANGYLGSPLTLNGSVVLTNGTFTDQSTTLPKGANITFQGTDSSFSSPSSFTTTYDIVGNTGGTVPLAELILTGTPTGGPSEQFSGTFIGSDDPNLPPSIPNGADTVTGDPGLIVLGTGQDAVFLVNPAVPEPASAAVMIITGSAMLLRRRRSRAG